MNYSLHTFETYKRILDLEERRGNLKKNTFSEKVQSLSTELKVARDEFKKANKRDKESRYEDVKAKKAEYEKERTDEIISITERIGPKQIKLREVNAKGKTGYTIDNVQSLLLSKVLMLELKRSYKYTPANRNAIIEELRALLDNPIPKVVIRADIHNFFESIPQDKLISKILEDAYLSALSMKCLKTFLYKYNNLSCNLVKKTGIPRGLSFSSYLAEIYLASFDRKVRQMEGVYFYKRYVDDIVIIANPFIHDKEVYWEGLNKEVESIGLKLSDDKDKRSCNVYSTHAETPLSMNYLGYQFRYFNGKLDVLLTDKKFNRYTDCIRLTFEKYKEIGNHTSRRNLPREKKMDTTLQFMHRLNALTGNGHLNSRKNYVLVGIYYSNKYLTTLEQLADLDKYIEECLNDPEMFSPSKAMFRYNQENDYEKNITYIKEKILDNYSFVRGFEERRIYRWSDYTTILKQLGNLYYSHKDDE